MKKILISFGLIISMISICQEKDSLDDYALIVFSPPDQTINDSIFKIPDIDSTTLFMIGRWNSDYNAEVFRTNLLILPESTENENSCTRCLLDFYNISRCYSDPLNINWHYFFDGLNYQTVLRIKKSSNINILSEIQKSRKVYSSLDQIASKICWYHCQNMMVNNINDSLVSVSFNTETILKEMPIEYQNIKFKILPELSEISDTTGFTGSLDYSYDDYFVNINPDIRLGLLKFRFDFTGFIYKNDCMCKDERLIDSKIFIKATH